jgi:hypothetical protein
MVQKRTEIPSTTEGPSSKRSRTQIPENLLVDLSVDAYTEIKDFFTLPQNYTRDKFLLLIKSLTQDFFQDLKENTLQVLFDKSAVWYGTRLILCSDIDNTLHFWDTYIDASSIFEDSLTKIIPWVFQNFSWAEPDLFLKQVEIIFNTQSKLCLQDFNNVNADEGLVLRLPELYEWGNTGVSHPLSHSPLGEHNSRTVNHYKQKFREAAEIEDDSGSEFFNPYSKDNWINKPSNNDSIDFDDDRFSDFE